MGSSSGRLVALAAAFLTATGCASVPRDAGLAEVERVVAERTGQHLAWDPAQPITAPESDAAIRAQLEGELTADRAVAIALAHNRELLATLEGLGLARADLIAASTVRNPVFDAETHFRGEPYKPYEMAVMQTLVDLVRLRSRRAVGRAAFEAERLRVAGAVVAFTAQVRTDHLELQAAQHVLAQERTIAAAAEAAAELALRQHEAGNISDLDLEQEQALYERARLDLARAELAELESRERLVADLGLLAPAPLTLPPVLPPIPAEPEQGGEAVEAALAARLDVELARAELEAARRGLPLARSEVWDELALGVHWDRESGGERARGPAVAVPIPLFDRGLAGRSRGVATLRQAEQRLHALTVSARSAARAARERVVEARARAEYLRDVVVPRRQRILALVQLEYNAMLRGAFDVVRARQELAQTEREAVLALRDYWVARTGLETELAGVAVFAPRRSGAGPSPGAGLQSPQQQGGGDH